MLTDLGKVSPEQKEKHRKFMCSLERLQYGGCVDTAICDKCDHMVRDSLCLCSGAFTCPNCGHKNGFWFERTVEDSTSKIFGRTVYFSEVAKGFYEGDRI